MHQEIEEDMEVLVSNVARGVGRFVCNYANGTLSKGIYYFFASRSKTKAES